ncbi:hypothetical protein [Methanobrevibacter sp.]
MVQFNNSFVFGDLESIAISICMLILSTAVAVEYKKLRTSKS